MNLAKASIIFLLALGISGCAQTMAPWILTEQEQPAAVEETISLVNADGDRFDVTDIESTFLDTDGKIGRKSTHVTLLHGMGPYPGKAYLEGAFSKLAEQHDAEVLLFHWPAWINFRTLPTANADASGPAFLNFLKELNASDANARIEQYFGGKSLLIHSMGTRVFRSALTGYQGGLRPDLFDSIVIVSAEVDLAKHADWLRKVDFAKNIYILVNGRDDVLAAPTYYYGKSRLGYSLVRADGQAETLADNAIYVQTENGTSWHSSYLTRRSDEMTRLFVWMIDGAPPAEFMSLLQPTNRQNVFSLVRHTP